MINHIKLLCLVSGALSLIGLILLMYGAWLFDNGLTTKLDIFKTVSVPLIGSIVCITIASLKNWSKSCN